MTSKTHIGRNTFSTNSGGGSGKYADSATAT